MSDKDKDLSLDDLGDLEIGGDPAPSSSAVDEDDFVLSFEDDDSSLSLEVEPSIPATLDEVSLENSNVVGELALGESEASITETLKTEDNSSLDSLSLDFEEENTSGGSAIDLGTNNFSKLLAKPGAVEDTGVNLSVEDLSDNTDSAGFVDLFSGEEASKGTAINFSLDELKASEEDLSLSDDEVPSLSGTNIDLSSENLSLEDEDMSLDLGGDEPEEEGTRVNLSLESVDTLDDHEMDFSLSLSDEDENVEEGTRINLVTEDIAEEGTRVQNADALFSLNDQEKKPEVKLSDDAVTKLREIDAIMNMDVSDYNHNNTSSFKIDTSHEDHKLDEPLVPQDLNLSSFGLDEEVVVEEKVQSRGQVRAKPEQKKSSREESGYEQDFRDVSNAYSGEMERAHATISNLRADREELLAKIQILEEEKVLHGRQTLNLRAELDEKKIELSIIRKKLNQDISDLKDNLKLIEEKKLILEEKNRILTQELDKAGQKNKIDVKRVQMRERELEQKLELLKADSETQIRNRDLKILELKRKMDAMEFDIESISSQEKRSVESRFELEDKLEKAIKTLRSAITVLEEETDKTSTIEALKKNIDM